MARIIVPLAPKIVNYKTQAILKHQSQKDGAKYLGDDKREFWQRAKIRNRNTA
jgi:glucosamine-6-phosphate deaminase